MSTESPESVATADFDAWKRNDIELVRPLRHEDVDFVVPSGPPKAQRRPLPVSAVCLR